MSNNKIKNIIKKIVFPIRFNSRRLIGGNRMEPSFIIVGAQKAGTTSLYKYLTQHPDIKATLLKEVHYFDLNYDKPLSWYQSFFPLKRNNKIITGEASPYYMFHPYAIKRIANFNANIKIIVLLREPASRAISHYYHEVRLGRETLGLGEAFNQEDQRMQEELEKFRNNQHYIGYNHQRFSYQSRSDYLPQIKEIKECFKEENIKIIDSKEFFKHTSETVKDVLKFLGVDPDFKIKTEKRFNSWEKIADPEEKEIYTKLKAKFKNSNDTLFDLIGKKFDWK
ncbi:sulfotransferase family protein [Formosa maritima]|uniref:Sulfotransferase domain-containing protein n=1 Tax=Formosa maritima TaxID=2592046 RepID=A0A5D0G0J1_9FLAO|nr:sulfotransferase domain-containing protein [Formosa maritima]TYA52224.1 sulfotransferase domain-containing protein [Formosa maritima]